MMLPQRLSTVLTNIKEMMSRAFFAAGVGAGMAIAKLFRYLPTSLEIVITEEEIYSDSEIQSGYRGDEQMQKQAAFFDCPACGLPAEITAIISQMTDTGMETNYVIACLGYHDRVAVSEQWLIENTMG